MKKVLSLLLALVMVIGLIPATALTASAAEESVTLATYGTTGTLAADSSSISWTSGNATFTNYKGSTAIRTSDSAHYRCYAGSSATFEYTGAAITKIEVTCASSSYATVFATSAGSEATASGTSVTIVPTASASTYTIKSFSAQTRISGVTIYADTAASSCAHTDTIPSDENKDATCTEDGLEGATVCAECDFVVNAGTVIPALGHSYEEGACTTCGAADPLAGLTIVTEPQGATAYKLIMQQNSLGKVLYFAGTIDGTTTYRLATTEDVTASPDVYLDVVTGGYQLYFLADGVKTYIRVSHMTDGDPGYGKGTLELTTTQPTEVYTFDATAKTLVYDYDGNNAYYMGTYNTYTTFGVSNTSYITGTNAGNLDVAQFPARLATVAGTEGGETPVVCQHTNTTTTAGTAATCTTAGTTDNIVCDDCSVTLQAAETIAATGHTYTEGVCTTCNDVAPVVPTVPTAGNYELVTDINEITAGGQFVIVTTYNGVPYAMDPVTSGKANTCEVVLKDNMVAYKEDYTPVWTIASYNDGIALVSGDGYLGYKSGTDFSAAAANLPYAWNVTANDDGTFYVTASGDATRQIALYDNYGTTKFGAYSNAGTNLTSYYYSFGLSFYKLTEGTPVSFTSTVTLVENGVATYTTEVPVYSEFVLHGGTIANIPEGYTYIGWTTTAVTEDTAIAPEMKTAAASVTVTNDVVYYALYTRTDVVEGGTVYNLVTDLASLAAGDKVIIAAATADKALSTNQKSNNRAATDAAKSGTTITCHDEVQVLTLEAGTQTGTFAFNTGAGYLYAASSSSNYLRTETTLSDNSSWLITVSADGVATATAQGTNTRNQLKYNSSSAIFAAYGSGQLDIALYKATTGTAATELYYTGAEYVPAPEVGTETNPIEIVNATDLTSVEAVAGGQTYYAISSMLNGMTLTIAGDETTTVTLNGTELTADENGNFVAELTGTPANQLIVGNTGTADAEWVAAIEYPLGSEQNPIIINTAEELGGLTVPANGTLYVLIAGTLSGKQLTVSAEEGIAVTVNGAAQVAGDYGFVTELNGAPTNRVVITNSTDAAVEVYASITELPGAESNPIMLIAGVNEITVPAGKTVYYAGRFGGMAMTAAGTGLTVEHNGTTYTFTTEGVTFGCVQTSMWEPCMFAVTNAGDADVTATLTVNYPLGSMDNADQLVIGENSATIAEGSQGYYYTWTAEKDGTLTITMPEGNWSYTINNMTTYVYGEQQWSDSDPVVNPATITVTAGDEIQVVVNTYDPANEWTAPAGTLTFTAAFEEPIEKFDIDVARMILGNALEFQFGVSTTKIPDKTGYYAVIEKSWADGTTTTETIPASQWGTAGQYWAIVYDGLAAKEMSDVFNVTVYNADGVAVSNAREDSVVAYVERAYAGQKATGKTMMVDMLNYGAAAQTHFDYGTDNLCNAGLTDAQKAVATATAPEMSNDQVKGTNYQGTRFLLTSAIQVQLGFKQLTTDMYAIYTYTNAAGEVKEVRVEGADFVENNGTKIGVELSALVYADARALVEVTVYNADGTVYATASDSIESACARSTGDVFVELMKFADSAKAHLYG